MGSAVKQVAGAALVIAGAFVTGGASLALQIGGAALLYSGARTAAKEAEAEAKRRAREQANSRSIKANIRGGSEAHFVCFGQVRAGGIVCAFGTVNRALYVGLAHSLSHPGGCESVRAIWVNDYRIPSTSMLGQPVDFETPVTDPRFVAADGTRMISLRTYRGTSTQTADSVISGLSGVAGSGAAAHRRGICWTRFTLTRPDDDPEGFAEAFPGGLPMLSVELRGNRCYDPREDSTNGGSGAHRLADETTWEWTQNSALIAATYMIMRTSDGGMGYATSRIDWPSVAAAANICDETVINSASSPTVSQARYKCNVALDTQDSRETNLQKILDTMMGVRVRVGDKYKIYAGAYISPTFELDSTYLRGPVRISTRSPLEQLYNAVRIIHDDEDQSYNIVEAPPFTSAAYEAQDGGERLWLEEARAAITNTYQAQYVGTVLGQMSRSQKIIEAPCNLKALNLEVWETGTVTLDELGIDGATYRLIAWEWEHDGPKLTLREETAETWEVSTYVAAVAPSAPAISTETPPAPAGFTATAVYDGVALRWTSPEPPTSAVSRIDVYRAGSGSPSSYAKIGSTSGLFYHDPVTDGATYSYLLKAVNYQGAASAFSAGAQATARTVPIIGSSGSGVSLYDTLNSSQNTHEFLSLLAERGIQILVDEGSGAVTIEALTSEDDHLSLSADFPSTSTTLADVTDFKFQLRENSLYCIKLRGLAQTAATSTGFKIGATAPTGSTMQLQVTAPDTSISTTGFNGFATGTTAVSITTANMPGANTTYPFLATFVISTGAESGSPSTGFVGDFQIQWATEVGSSSATLKADSLMVADLMSNATPTVTLTLGSPGFAAAYTSEDSGPSSASASLTLTCKTDGTWTIAGGSGDTVTGTPLSGNWGTPTTADAGDSYEAKFTVSGHNGIGSIVNEASDWIAITDDRIFRLTVISSAGSKTGSLSIQQQVRRIGTSSPVSDGTTSWTVTAESGV